MQSEPLSYLEWALLRWAAEMPRYHLFYITGDKIVSQFDFTPDADKAARKLIGRSYFTSSEMGRYSINEQGIEASLIAEQPTWEPRKMPAFGEAEHKVLSVLHDWGASTDWTHLDAVPGMGRTKLVAALQALVAHGMASAVERIGSTEVFTKDNVLRPNLFKKSRFGWHYKLTSLGIEKLCELDLAEGQDALEIDPGADIDMEMGS